MKESTATFETKVTLKMICLYIWAWLINGSIVHKNITITTKENDC